jgi:pilus assembly protein CpaC
MLLRRFLICLAAVAQAQQPAELRISAGKSVVVSSELPVERVAVGFGEVAEATPVNPQEILVHGKTPGDTTLIVWQQGGTKLFFDVIVEPNLSKINARVDAVRAEIRQELAGQDVRLSFQNDTAFLRGTVNDLTSAERAAAIAGTLGKTVNLLYVAVPAADQQILLKVQFVSVDRSVSSELGLNLVSTGAANTIGAVTTGQFPAPRVEVPSGGRPEITLGDALNIFLFRPDLNLAATIRALQRRALFEILAEPNVLAIDGKQASFLAGGEFPYPTLQGGGAGLGAVTIQFREFGVRINFIPTVTPRGTIKLRVAPEVSALDFVNGLVFQGFNIPALTVRRVDTQIELKSGQSFAIGGLLDRRLTETLHKIPLLGDVPVLGKIFQSRALNRENTELLVIVTPEIVQPIPQGQPLPQIEFPKPLMGPDEVPRTPGMETTGTTLEPAPRQKIPVEQLQQDAQENETRLEQGGLRDSRWPPPAELPSPSPPK